MALNKVDVTINSRRYTVLADESDEYIKNLAEHIDEKVRTVLQGGQNVMGERPIVLAALNICDEYYKCIEAGRVLQQQTELAGEKLVKANAEIKRLKSLSPQISFEEKETEKKLQDAEHKVKLLETKINELEEELKKSRRNEHADRGGHNKK